VKKRLIPIFFLILLAGVGTLVWRGQQARKYAELYYSGTIEAKDANLSFQVGGRVKTVAVSEGHAVKKGQVIAELETEELTARRDQAKANLDLAIERVKGAEITLDIYKKTLPAEVEKAEFEVKALKAQSDELAAGFRTQEVERAKLAFHQAEITMKDARKDKDRFDALFKQGGVSEKDRDAAALKSDTAFKLYEQAKTNYEMLKEGSRKETIDASKARLSEGQTMLTLSKANLKKIEGAQQELEAAKAQVQAAKAALDTAEIQLGYAKLISPSDAIVTSRNIEPGEVVSTGREVISIADLSRVDVKVFVSETEIGKAKPGQKADVKIDTFPDKVYLGEVAYISPEGEFTPKIIQTHKERVKLVYLVKISVPNPNFELKTGMPADVWFR
jgi:HlyD family secretion protein